MDFARPYCRAYQCLQRASCTLGPPGGCRLRYFRLFPREVGVPMDCEKIRELGCWCPLRNDDDYYPCVGVHLRLLHGCYRHPCHLRKFSATHMSAVANYELQGGFIAGLIIPHENGYAIALVEKLEDLVSLLFLPLVRDVFRSHQLKPT